MSAAPPTARPRRAALGVRAAVAGMWVTLAAAIAYVLTFDPTDRAADPTGPCTWHALFGINGPTCGGTRMVWYLLHGDLVQAARHHLVALIGVPFALYALAAWTARTWWGRSWPLPRLSRWIYLGYAAAWLVYAVVLRNLPWPPFTWFDIPNLT
jgi:Protein of unknown function (DUF2752)